MPQLVKYFQSGWAFLLPYLLLYLLYAWQKWPVNPPALPASTLARPLCLLHLYWWLHGLHAVLGGLALRAWWRTGETEPGGAAAQPASTWDRLAPVAPWIPLGLLFLIPGVFLEFPADPWEHYSRISEWGGVWQIGDHGYWTKFGYFLSYSFLGQIPLNQKFAGGNIYYAGSCLLLCWQYARLARAAGLARNATMVFVVIQALLFGNNIFSFYRYYGISTTLHAQLGAVALIRLVLAVLTGPAKPRAHYFHRLSAILCLLPLIAFSHVQGFGLAALGVAAVAVWRLIEWRRSMIGWLAGAAVVLSLATINWLPRHPALGEIYGPQGWLSGWHGFNLFSPLSPAGGRTQQILGTFGWVNFVAGLWLLRRNQVAGWLTVTPVLALCLPFVAIPLANALAQSNADNILTFHRMLFSIPSGLALIALAEEARARWPLWNAGSRQYLPALLLPLALGLFLITPAGYPHYNRLWNAWMISPGDLRLSEAARLADPGALPDSVRTEPHRTIYPRAVGVAAHAVGIRGIPYDFRARAIIPPNIPADHIQTLLGAFATATEQERPTLVLLPLATTPYTPGSLTGYLSVHWSPQQVALGYVAISELQAAALHFGAREIPGNGCSYYVFTPAKR